MLPPSSYSDGGELVWGDSSREALVNPHSVLEAGGESSPVLMAALARRVAELEPGQVLEIVSQATNARLDAVAWCHVTGHELLGLLADGDETRFWIRKRSA